MYLTRLEIQGFKSFAKKTVFEFEETSNHDKTAKSISSIVGPNGSGKSNVADAIRWVLGEQSLKLIRCKKSDDVIFHGSHSKARQGFAEVSLHFDNSDKKLPVDFTEVMIARRVYRDGETEYLLNKKRVRLFDILMLAAKANFGQKSYSIVGQGMVDHIINISAFERKEFFDEATGVKQYQIKRDQAVNRLKRSRDNLTQTNQILQELEPRLRLLTRQIKKLEKRKEIEVELRDLQLRYYGHSWNKFQKEKKGYEENFAIKDEIKKDLDLRLNELQVTLAEYARQESRKDVFNNLQKEFNKLVAEKNDLLKDGSVLKGKMSLEYVKVGKQNLSWLQDKKEEIEKRMGEVKESLNNLEIKISHKDNSLKEDEERLRKLQEEIIVLENNYNAVKEDLANIKNGDRVNFALEAVKAVLRQKNYIKGVYGTVGQLAKVDEMYEAALATAVGGRVNSVVVKDESVAVKCISYLKENRLNPVTFLPLNKIKTYGNNREMDRILAENGAIGMAVNLIAFDPKYKKVYDHILGNTVVVDNVENAKEIGVSRERMVTLEGDILEKNGAIRGGYQKKGYLRWRSLDEDKSLLNQEQKLKEIAILEERMGDRRKEKEDLINNINELRIDLQVSEAKNKGLTNEWVGLEKEKTKIVSEIEENEISPEDQDKYLISLNKKKKELDKKVVELDNQIFEIRNKIDKFNLDEEKKKELVFKKQDEMQSVQMKLNEINNGISELKISLARVNTKREELEREALHELKEVDLDKISLDEVINVDQLWFEISKLKGNLEQIGGIDPEIIEEHKEVTERYQFLNEQSKDLEKAINDLEKIVVELDVIITKQFNKSFKIINKAFDQYFQKIFIGGKAKLELVQKDDNGKQQRLFDDDGEEARLLPEEKSKLVNTGIEIMVAPPNKKINNIAVLSGGERTMTSLALICAIISSNPSPFIVMDEVDAALDESNSEKFGAILQELSYHSQFVVITHNRVIMHVADALYGIAMGDDGVSKTLSLSLKEAKETAKK